jgi:F0F1-type ATP synthase membrane subunit c/vacuolar-type H+-ATPase subunit K
MQGQREIDHKYRTLVIVWLVLITAQIAIIGAVMSFRGKAFEINAGFGPFGAEPAIVVGAAIFALTNLVISFVMRQKALEQAIAEQNIRFVQTAVVFGGAFCESISIIGLVLAVAFGYEFFYLWFALGLAGIFFHFPRRRHLIDASRAATLK